MWGYTLHTESELLVFTAFTSANKRKKNRTRNKKKKSGRGRTKRHVLNSQFDKWSLFVGSGRSFVGNYSNVLWAHITPPFHFLFLVLLFSSLAYPFLKTLKTHLLRKENSRRGNRSCSSNQQIVSSSWRLSPFLVQFLQLPAFNSLKEWNY